MGRLSYWHRRQLFHYIGTLPKEEKLNSPLTITIIFEWECVDKGPAFSLLYSSLIAQPEGHTPPYLQKWETDMKVTLTSTKKMRILWFKEKLAFSTKYKESGFKILTRWNTTPSILSKMFPGTSSICWRCREREGSILHMFWECPHLDGFWKGVQRVIHEVTITAIASFSSYTILSYPRNATHSWLSHTW